METNWIQAIPKVELHRHLEGSIRPATVWDEAQRQRLTLPANSLEEVRPYLQYTPGDERSLIYFLTKFQWIRRILTNKETVERVVYESLEDAHNSNTIYAELRFNPSGMFQMGMTEEDIADGLRCGIRRAYESFGIRASLICGIMRDRDMDTARRVVNFAQKYAGDLIVGMDLFSDETYPSAPFADLFAQTKAAGLHLTIHAGEACNPARGAKNIEDAVLMGTERIGHGVRITEDPHVVELVRDRGVLLEMCPTSNVQTGVTPSLEDHPLPALFRSGVAACINTDDPEVSATTLTNEYIFANERMGLSPRELKQMVHLAGDYIFDDSYRPQLKAALQAAIPLDTVGNEEK